jgi:hypothetical protein
MDTSIETKDTLVNEKPKRRGKTKEELDRLRPLSRPIKHGLFVKLNIKRVDCRTKLGKLIRALKNAIIEDLGGKDKVSRMQEMLIDSVIIPQWAALNSFNNSMIEGEHEAREGPMKYWIGLGNSLTRNCAALGLKLRVIEPLTLEKYIEEKYGQDEKAN